MLKFEDETIAEAYDKLADAFQKHFGVNLGIEFLHTDGNQAALSDDGDNAGVEYLGTVRSNWLKRHSKDYGFTVVGYVPGTKGIWYAYTAGLAKGDDELPAETGTTVEEISNEVNSTPVVEEEDFDELEQHVEVVQTEEEPENISFSRYDKIEE